MFPLKQVLIFVLVLVVVFFAAVRFLTMTRNPFIERALGLPSSEASNSNFSPADYPRTYRTSLIWRALHLMFWFALIWSVLAGPQVRESWLVPGIVLGIFFIGGILSMLYDLKYRVVLFADSIEVRTLASTRALRRDEILGRRLLQLEGPSSILLVPRGAQRGLWVQLVLNTDSAFWEWMNTLPDLDVT